MSHRHRPGHRQWGGRHMHSKTGPTIVPLAAAVALACPPPLQWTERWLSRLQVRSERREVFAGPVRTARWLEKWWWGELAYNTKEKRQLLAWRVWDR